MDQQRCLTEIEIKDIRRIASRKAYSLGFTLTSRSGHSVEDIVQDVLLRLHRSTTFRAMTREEQALYIGKVVRNRCFTVLNKLRKQLIAQNGIPAVANEQTTPESLQSSDVSIELFKHSLPENLAGVLEVILRCGGNKAEAARTLGLSKKSIQNRWSEIIKHATDFSCTQHDAHFESMSLHRKKTSTQPKAFRSRR